MQMKRDRILKEFQLFGVITGVFLLSRILIINSILLANVAVDEEFRWASKSSAIFLPNGAQHLFFKGSSPKKQTIGIYVNNTFLKNITLDEKPSFHCIELGSGALIGKSAVQFRADNDFIPSVVDKGNSDNRNLSWVIYYAGTDTDPRNNLVVQYMESDGFYGLERYPNIKSALEKGFSHWDANWYVSIIEKGYQFDGNYKKQQNIPWPYIYPLISYPIKALFNCSALWAGVIVNNGMFFLSLFLIYYLSRLLIANGIMSYMPLLLLSFHPFNVFSASAFTEGLFIFCLSISIILLLKERYILFAIICGALNGIRIVGVAASFILLYHFFVIQKNRPSPSNLLKATFLSFTSLWGLFSHMLFLKIKFNDPLANFKAASAWAPAGGRKWSIFFDNLDHYFRNITHMLDPYILGITLAAFIILYCIYYFFVRRRYLTKVEHTFILYSLCLVLVTIIPQKEIPPSIGRYTLPCFPVLILLSHRLENSRTVGILLLILWLIFSVYLSLLFTMSFSKGLPPF
jgi:hypothetical protein